MRYIIPLFIIIGLIGCETEESNSLLDGIEKEYLISELQADSLLISESFKDQCSTAVFTFYNSRTIQNPPRQEKYKDSPFEPQWDYSFDVFKEIDSILMTRKINVHTVDLRYRTDGEEIYKLTINKRDCADTIQAEVKK